MIGLKRIAGCGFCALMLSAALSAMPVEQPVSASDGNDAAPNETTAATQDAQTPTVSSAFVKLPVGVLDILPSWTREDMLAYFRADSIWEAPNSMGGVSSLTKMTPDFLEVKISDVSTMQIRRLPFKKGYVFMTVYTVGAEGAAPDSQVNFYTESMSQLPTAKFLPNPRLLDYLDIPKDSRLNKDELQQLVAFPTYKYSITPEGLTLSSVLTVGDYMTREDFEQLKPYVRPSGVSYIWDGNKFKKITPNNYGS